ncbi:sel1 repeat family protein [Myxococcota bacterium]|nr:sel1 repeat family protein [Myxococcota bacterium]MBU1537966.1 sel1 repeat family protein [Myxococcota bacterium]
MARIILTIFIMTLSFPLPSMGAKCPAGMRFDPVKLTCVRAAKMRSETAFKAEIPLKVPSKQGPREYRMLVRKGNRHGARREYGPANTFLQKAWLIKATAPLVIAIADNARLMGDWRHASDWYEKVILRWPALKNRSRLILTNRLMGKLSALSAGCTGGTKPQCRAYVKELMPVCRKGNTGACNIAGYLELVRFKRNTQGKSILKTACDAKVPFSCFLYARAFNKDVAHPRYKPLIPLLKRACEGHVFKACHFLGDYLRLGRGTAKDYKLSAYYLQRACDNRVESSCTLLGFLYSQGYGVTKDQSQALSLYEKGCTLKDSAGCAYAGSRHRLGIFTPKDIKKAKHFYTTACNLGRMSACVAQGELLATGKQPVDRKTAMELFRKACNASEASGCYRLGTALLSGTISKARPQLAFKHLKRACTLKSARGCQEVGFALMYGTMGQTKSSAAAAPYLAQACSSAAPGACTRYGYLLEKGDGVKKDLFRAAFYYNRACDLKDGGGCFFMAMLYVHNKVVNPKPHKRVEFLSRACDLSYARGCFGLGLIHERGVDVAQSKATATAYYKKGCTLGDRESCKKIKKQRKPR